jgi:hypothetical protein
MNLEKPGCIWKIRKFFESIKWKKNDLNHSHMPLPLPKGGTESEYLRISLQWQALYLLIFFGARWS